MYEWIYSIILYLFLSSKTTYSTITCSDKIVCPPDKPYCTDGGCVYECPRPLYTNGSTCIPSCGDWFITGSSCVRACPSDWYYRETPIVINYKTFIEKTCTPDCFYDEFRIGNSCVHACPLEFGFIDGQQCVDTCPQNRHFLFKFTIKSISYYRCLDRCPKLADGVFCTDECGADLFGFNSTCVHTCPDSHPLKSGKICAQTCSDEFIYYDNNNTCQSNCSSERPFFYSTNQTCGNICLEDMYISTRRGAVYCEEQCQQHEVVYKRSCFTSCSEPNVVDTKLYLMNGTCVDRCPDGMLKKQNTQGQWLCTDACAEDEFSFNMSCVDLCPLNSFMVNSTCVEECPPEMPYVCQAHKGQSCDQICPPIMNGNFHDICVDKCPFYRDGYNCVQICSESKYTYDGLCATKCPLDRRVIQQAQISFQTCSFSTCYFCDYPNTKTYETQLRNTCVSACQDDLVIFNLTCQSSCPDEYPYVVNRTCQDDKCPRFMYKLPNFINCTDECKTDEFMYNSSCVNQCPDYTFVTNRKCHLDNCTTKYSYKRDNITFCTDDCTQFGFVLDTTCSDTCPALLFNNTCVNFCPETHSILYNYTTVTKNVAECVNACSEDRIQFNGSCITKCPNSTFVFNNSCVHSCPESHRLRQYDDKHVEGNCCSCVERCADPYPLLNKHNLTCVGMCPQLSKYIHLNNCEEYCPAENIQYHTSLGIVCSDKCPPGKLQFNLTCVDNCPQNFYNYRNQICVYDCPGDVPFGLQSESWRCVDACETNKYFKDGKCVYSYECEEPYFTYLGQCVKNCPKYFVWMDECRSLMIEFLPETVALALTVSFLLFYSRQLLKEYFLVWRIMFYQTVVDDKEEDNAEDNVNVQDDDQQLLLVTSNDDDNS